MKKQLLFVTIGLLLVGPVAAEDTTDVQLPSIDSLQAVELDQLDDLRGRENITLTETTVSASQNLEATISGNMFSSGEIDSGEITFGDHSLDNFSGIGVFNALTGNNNAVNATVGVNIYIQGDLTQQ